MIDYTYPPITKEPELRKTGTEDTRKAGNRPHILVRRAMRWNRRDR